jgi:hypothetical protein
VGQTDNPTHGVVVVGAAVAPGAALAVIAGGWVVELAVEACRSSGQARAEADCGDYRQSRRVTHADSFGATPTSGVSPSSTMQQQAGDHARQKDDDQHQPGRRLDGDPQKMDLMANRVLHDEDGRQHDKNDGQPVPGP